MGPRGRRSLTSFCGHWLASCIAISPELDSFCAERVVVVLAPGNNAVNTEYTEIHRQRRWTAPLVSQTATPISCPAVCHGTTPEVKRWAREWTGVLLGLSACVCLWILSGNASTKVNWTVVKEQLNRSRIYFTAWGSWVGEVTSGVDCGVKFCFVFFREIIEMSFFLLGYWKVARFLLFTV